MPFDDGAHQSVGRATNRRDLGQHLVAVDVLVELPFQCRDLAPDATDAGQQFRLVVGGMHEGSGSGIAIRMIYP